MTIHVPIILLLMLVFGAGWIFGAAVEFKNGSPPRWRWKP